MYERNAELKLKLKKNFGFILEMNENKRIVDYVPSGKSSFFCHGRHIESRA